VAHRVSHRPPCISGSVTRVSGAMCRKAVDGRSWAGLGIQMGRRSAAPPAQGEIGMPVWTVQVAGVEDEIVEAGLVATEGGALVALSEDGLMVRAWAPGQWRTVRYMCGADADPADQAQDQDDALVGLDRG